MIAFSITQPLRAHYCAALASQLPSEQPIVIFTSDTTPFRSLDLPDNVEISIIAANPQTVPSQGLTTGRIARRVLAWARSGSTLGLRLERILKALAWRLRYLDRIAIISRKARRRRRGTSRTLLGAPIGDALSAAHDDTPISKVIVFDLFDLPAARGFAEAAAIDVLIR